MISGNILIQSALEIFHVLQPEARQMSSNPVKRLSSHSTYTLIRHNIMALWVVHVIHFRGYNVVADWCRVCMVEYNNFKITKIFGHQNGC